MLKQLIASLLLVPALASQAIVFTFDKFNDTELTCTLTGWTGEPPYSASGVRLDVPVTTQKDGKVYKVTEIAAGALNDFDYVTEIHVSSYVAKIGSATEIVVGDCQNFRRCLNLAKITVSSLNPYFSSTSNGMLLANGGHTLVKVPQRLDCGSSILPLSEDIYSICPEAFAENATITSIGIPSQLNTPHSNCGFNSMKVLKEFYYTKSSSRGVAVSDKILYDKSMKILISYPPFMMGSEFTPPAGVTTLQAQSMANIRLLQSVNTEQIEVYGAEALSGSAITAFNLAYSDVTLGEGTLRDCSQLKSILLPRKCVIPANFARDCSSLERITLTDVGYKVNDCAFMGCKNLSTYSFNVDNRLDGDSIFAFSGLKNVIFSRSNAPEENLNIGKACFYGCKQLEEIDLSGILTQGKSTGLEIDLAFAANCPKLHTVQFPRLTHFWSSTTDFIPAFGDDPAVSKIVIGAFTMGSEYGAPIVMTDSVPSDFSLYVNTTDAPYRCWPLDKFFHVAEGLEFRPAIYCDNYDMSDPEYGVDSQYICTNADYYVPARSADNYKGVLAQGGTLTEMFSYEETDEEGKYAVSFASNLGDSLVIREVYVDKEYISRDEESGRYISNVSRRDAKNLRVLYTVNGVSMATEYAILPPTVGIRQVSETLPALKVVCNGSKLMMSKAGRYEIYHVNGSLVMQGLGTEVEIEMLMGGCYIMKAEAEDGSRAVHKFAK